MSSQIEDEDWHILCGMPQEKKKLAEVFPDVPILSGTDKLNLPALIPPTCKRIVVMGIFGGLAKGINVGDFCIASTIVDEAGTSFTCDPNWNLKLPKFATIPWYSSGIMDQADTTLQRSTLLKRYGVYGIDDEARYAVALALARPGLMVNDARDCSDDWRESLPLAATGAVMNKNGTIDIADLLKSIAIQSIFDNLDLFKIALDFGTSLSGLKKGALIIRDTFS